MKRIFLFGFLISSLQLCFGQFKIINNAEEPLMQVDTDGNAAITGKTTTTALQISGSSPGQGMLLYSGDTNGNLLWTPAPSQDNQILKWNHSAQTWSFDMDQINDADSDPGNEKSVSAVKVYRNTSTIQTGFAHSSWVPLEYDVFDWAKGSGATDYHNGTSEYYYQAPKDGIYYVSANVTFDSEDVDRNVRIRIVKLIIGQEPEILAVGTNMGVNDPGMYTTTTIGTMVALNANDRIQIQGNQKNAAANTVDTSSGTQYYKQSFFATFVEIPTVN